MSQIVSTRWRTGSDVGSVRRGDSVFVPSVVRKPMHALDLSEPFFYSLRADYAGFEDWFRRAARSGREALVVDGPDGNLAGLCILKGTDHEIGVGQDPAKVSTLKVAEEFKWNRYGDLLLKVLFKSVAGRHNCLWLTVFPRQTELISRSVSLGPGPDQHCRQRSTAAGGVVSVAGSADQSVRIGVGPDRPADTGGSDTENVLGTRMGRTPGCVTTLPIMPTVRHPTIAPHVGWEARPFAVLRGV